MTEYNYIPNPRAHVDVATWLTVFGALERVTSVPWGSMPDGADAALKLPTALRRLDYYFAPDDGGQLMLPAGESVPFTLTWGAHDDPAEGIDPATDATLRASLDFWDAGWNLLGRVWLTGTWLGENAALDEWHVKTGSFAVPDGAVHACLLGWACATLGGHDGATGYITKLRIGGSEYKDGDSSGWEWIGTAHASVSREVEPQGTILINGGAAVVFDPDVTLTLNPGDLAATEMAVRNDEDGYGAWEAFAATKAWTLSAACKVWAKFRDGA